jgi:hypothetical protein
MKDYKNDLLMKMLGLAPKEPEGSLSKLLGLDPPPVSPSRKNFWSDLNRATPAVPVSHPISTLSSLLGWDSVPASDTFSSLVGAPFISGLSRNALSDLIGVPPVRPPTPVPSGIRFQNACFSEPKPLFSEWLPMQPGLYAVLVFDLASTPRPYRPIYFGKAADLAKRVTNSHEKYSEWCRACKSVTGLYVAYYSMPNSSEWERGALEKSLIKAYMPQCNDAHNPLSDAFGF